MRSLRHCLPLVSVLSSEHPKRSWPSTYGCRADCTNPGSSRSLGRPKKFLKISKSRMSMEKNHFYRFGSFRLDPAKRLLLRGQKPVSLMPKAFDTLLVLVENRNRLVGKEELMKTLWPDSFVEEANLAQNVAVLRKALGDSPEEHRYILTVPGHGYRFAAKVSEEIEDDEADLVIERHSRSRVLVEESGVRSGHAGILAIFSSVLKRRWNWILGGAAIVAFILAVVLRLTSHRPPPLGESDLVLVSDFVNTTGEPIFDGSLKQALKVKLSES